MWVEGRTLFRQKRSGGGGAIRMSSLGRIEEEDSHDKKSM